MFEQISCTPQESSSSSEQAPATAGAYCRLVSLYSADFAAKKKDHEVTVADAHKYLHFSFYLSVYVDVSV